LPAGVDDDVQPAEAFDDGADDPLGLGFPGDVGDDGKTLRAGGSDPLGGRLGVGLDDIRDGHPGACTAQRDGKG